MCSYYRKFVDSFANIASPLNALLRKDSEKKFHWTLLCQEAFDKLKKALLSAPILAYPDMNKPFMLTCDASSTAIGFVLGQLDSQGREHVIAYGGRSLSRAERICRKLGRWALKLQDFDFDIVHKPGKNNEVADALSRRTYTEVADENKTSPVKVFVANANEFLLDTIEVNACETDLEVDNKGDEDLESVELELFYGDYTLLAPLDPEVVNSELLDIPAVGQLQQVDPDFQDMFNYLQNDVLPQSEKVRQKVLAESQDYSVCDGVLYKWFQKRFKTKSR
ncbi:Hypothetical predicted protein [Mytilus galloprovincialis]|uniref:Reverse transcriptase/retrotransposon-derived protein RNase H-like domain-containing protein n=1 Tax=Mytilus galloprovincialis TaxID=29158 RepID=A0A8B6FFE8_MYTGA|nr:Hypothetical predicted protein [Mytilus galloprovincialis]